MRKILKKFPKFLKEERAQTTTEYVIIVALVALLAIKVGKQLKGTLEDILGKTTEKTSTNIDQMWTE